MRIRFVWMAAAALLFASGCASGTFYVRTYESFQKQLEGDKGKLTFEEAVGRWGRPSRINPGTGVYTVFWESHDRKEPSPVARHAAAGRSQAWGLTPKGWRLTLVFWEQADLMKSWKYESW